MSQMPSPDPKSNKEPILKFRDEYEHALSLARVSEEHTSTEGWRTLYAGVREADKVARREGARRLRLLADAMEMVGLSEEDEKGIKDIVKNSAELREKATTFERETVDRVTAPVMQCEQLIQNHIFNAEQMESRDPMFNIGILELMKMEVAKQPKPWFDKETGVVSVR